jgi:hypothetical protein
LEDRWRMGEDECRPTLPLDAPIPLKRIGYS